MRAARTTEPALTVRGLVRTPRAFSLVDLFQLADVPGRPSGTLPLADVLSVARLDRRAELLGAVDRAGRSVVVPLRRVVHDGVAVLRLPTAASHLDVRLDAPEWTPARLPVDVVELVALTFDDFITSPTTTAGTCDHEDITVNAEHTTALMRRVQAGDRGAFGDLYDAIAPQVFGVVKRVLRDPAMSEEVTQEVFVEIWTHAARYDPQRANVSTWAVTLARRRAVDRVRREQSQRDRLEQLRRQPIAPVAAPDAVVEAAIDAESALAAIDRLPSDQREVIRLAFLDGNAHGTIAELLDLPLGTVKGRVRGGLRRLRTLLDTPGAPGASSTEGGGSG